MEAREGMSSGVTVIGAEAPSNYHVAPRAENLGQVSGSPPVSGTPLSMGISGTAEKKKRGRPRKYGPDSRVPVAFSPTPISSSIPPTDDFSSGKRGRGRSGGYLSKLQKKMGMENLGDFGGISGGTNFMPHIINVSAGEDVTMKVISFSQQGPRAICILSANGAISNVTLRQSDSSGGTLTYEGRFEILSLSGSFMPTETQGSRSRSGGMSVSLASTDGRVVGGSVAGLLVAASPVQVVVGSFLPSNHLDEKPKKVKFETTRATTATAVAGPEANDEKGDDAGGHGLTNSETSRPNLDSSPTFGGENWAAMQPLQQSRKMTTDINMSVPGG